MKQELFYLLLIVTLSSCSVFESGQISSGPLLSRNDKYVDIAVGKAKSKFWWQGGRANNEDLMLKAKNNLYFNRPLNPGEYYSNITTNINKRFFLIKITVSADVMISSDTMGDVFSKNFKRLIGSDYYIKSVKAPKKMENLLMQGDSVYYSDDSKNYNLYTILSTENNMLLLKASTTAEKNKLVPLKKQFFIRNVTIDGLKSNDLVEAKFMDANLITHYDEGIIMGVSDKEALVQTKNHVDIFSLSKLKKK